MEKEKVQELLEQFNREDKEVIGLLVFNIKSSEIVASTFDKDQSEKIIKIEQETEEMEREKFSKIDSAGPKTWAMYSLERKMSAVARVKGDIFVSAEYSVEKSPGGAIEDILEIALLVNNT